MKVQLLSDLHLERDPSYRAEPVPGAEVLVLAGDVGSYQRGSRLADPDFGLAQFSPHLRPSAWRTVLYVPGNHEYDGLEFEPTHTRLQQTCARLGITWLEREVVVIGRTRFVGTTLWSDFDALLSRSSAGASPASLLARQFDQREKAFRAANFYLRKHSALRDGEPMLADAWRELSLESQRWLREQLDTRFDGTTVVVTHFAPSLRSADPRYGLVPGTAGFCNDLETLFPWVDVWMHGHLHCPIDYTVSGVDRGAAWSCRVVANPLGYAAKGEQEGFVPSFCVELPD